MLDLSFLGNKQIDNNFGNTSQGSAGFDSKTSGNTGLLISMLKKGVSKAESLAELLPPVQMATGIVKGIGQDIKSFKEKGFVGGVKSGLASRVDILKRQLSNPSSAALSFSGGGIGVMGSLEEAGAREMALPSLEQTTKAPEAISPEESGLKTNELSKNVPSGGNIPPEGKYVKDEPITIRMGKNDKGTARNLREEFSGVKNAQIVRGNQLRDEIKSVIKDPLEREGMFWYKAAQGDEGILKSKLNDPAYKEIRPQIEAALNLSDAAKTELNKVSQYYQEAGDVATKNGTIRSIRENYQNRLYQQEPPSDFVKSELKKGIQMTTRHAKQRIFDTEFQAIEAGKKFSTTDVADALSIHNQEMARVNTSRKLGQTMVDNQLAAWRRPDNIPEGWDKVGNIEKRVPLKNKDSTLVLDKQGNQFVSQSVLTAPKGIAKGLEAISDPNYLARVDTLRGIQRFQGLVKTVDLSFSFFHHKAMVQTSLFQGEYNVISKLANLDKIISSPVHQELEQDFARNTGMTFDIESNVDILKNLVSKDKTGVLSKIENAPVIKQTLGLADKNTNLLFNKIQRVLKVEDYGNKISNWVAKHPEATNEEVSAAKRSLAKEVNSAYGGLNWEAMGMTKTNLAILRNVLLAPDWTISNLDLIRQGFTGGAGGSAARAYIARSIIGGMILTEGLNKILTGHFTDENKSGHKLEIEIAPNVYTSLFVGSMGDFLKLAGMVQESGAVSGPARFLQGKAAPLIRPAAGLLGNVDYTGRPITKAKEGFLTGTSKGLQYLMTEAGPVPFGISTEFKYISDPESNVPGTLGVLSGVGRYSKGKTKKKFNLDFLQ